MYKAKIINFEGLSTHWLLKHKIGEFVKFADERLHGLKNNVQVIEHYKMVTISKKKCKECGHYIIKREKDILDY